MRDKKEPHLNLLNLMTRNKIAQELEALAHLLDAHQDILAPVKSRWVYQKLRNFRAGMEGNISRLKRAFGLDRCI